MTGFLFVSSFVGLLALVPLRKIMIIDYKLSYPSGTDRKLGFLWIFNAKEFSNGEAPPLPPSNFIARDDSTLFEDGFGWKALAIGYACGFMFRLIMGYVVFKTTRPAWFLKMVEDQWSLHASRTKKCWDLPLMGNLP
ncbi:hypothetical protein NC652_024670 [Populus alba x Populus x berolinensis]|nr:hypothetical protein NC652_024670 [Populus alba x Populus x berolinensis]